MNESETPLPLRLLRARRERPKTRQSRRTADTAERNKLYAAMTRIISAQAPWCTNVYRISNTVIAPHIRGYRKNVHYFLTPWEYLDMATARAKGEAAQKGR